MVRLKSLVVVLLVLIWSTFALAEGPTVAAGDNPNALPLAWFGMSGLSNPNGLEGPEGFIGSGSSSAGEEFDFYGGFACNGLPTIGSWNDSNHVVLRYCATTGSLSARVDASPSYCLDARIGAVPEANYIQLDLVNRASETTVNFLNVVLTLGSRRINLGSFEGSGWNIWHVQGIDFSRGFTIEGDIVLKWPKDPSLFGQSTNKLILTLGSVPSLATASIGENSSGRVAQTVASR
jgi:hypothetical protein